MAKVVCVECSGVRCWKKGLVPGRTGAKQRYVCFDCGRTFYKPVENPKKVVKAKPKTASHKAQARRAEAAELGSLVDGKTAPQTA